MSETNSVKLTLGYSGGDKRAYNFDDVADSIVAGVKANVKALNASLNGGQLDDFKAFFVSDSGANANAVEEAFIINIEETDLDISEEE